MSESGNTAPVLRLREPGDLIEMVPYLLGFHPRQSLVIVGLARTSVVLTTRVDLGELPPAADQPVGGRMDYYPDDPLDPFGWGSSAVDETLAVIADSGATSVVGLIFDHDGHVGELNGGPEPSAGVAWGDIDGATWSAPPAARYRRWGNAVRMLAASADRQGIDLVDALLIGTERWWSYLCPNPECCPPEGRPLAGDSSPSAAAATYAGLVALGDRGDLASLLEVESAATTEERYNLLARLERDAMRANSIGSGERYRRSVKRAIFADARRSDTQLLTVPADEERVARICRFAIGLSEIAVRDAVWIAVDHGRLDGRALWREIAGRVPPPYGAPALFLFGWAEWRDGNAVMARIAAERAIECDPGYSAAQLLLGAISHALDPRRTPRLRLPRSA